MAKKRVIKVRLSESSVQEAIKEIEAYKQEVIDKAKLLAKRLAEIGVGIAQMEIGNYDAIFSGELQASMNLRAGDVLQYGSTYYVYTACPWAKYVEFGTGIVGARESNPLVDEQQISWTYDSHGHGDKGWHYFKDGEWHWTKGMPARPFMLSTSWDLQEKIVKIAKEVFTYG